MEGTEVNKSLKLTSMKTSRRDEVSGSLLEDEISANLQEDFEIDRSSILPEELVENILAMVPFPYVFKARVLSKSWLARLSPISSQDNKEKKRLAILFQKKVLESSTKWKTFCPVHFSNEHLVAYHRASRSWQRVPCFPKFIHEGVPPEYTPYVEHMGGALLLWGSTYELYVANILTRECKQLPPLPDEHCKYRRKCVIETNTSETYKVIILTQGPRDDHQFIFSYDSASTSWSNTKVATSTQHSPLQFATTYEYADGVLYTFVHDFWEFTFLKVVAFNIKEETSVEISITPVPQLARKTAVSADPVICNANLLLVFLHDGTSGSTLVWKIDLERELSLGTSQSPQRIEMHPVSHDGQCVFSQVESDGNGVCAYNIHANQWEFCPYFNCESGYCPVLSKDRQWIISSLFRPGLTPFVAV